MQERAHTTNARSKLRFTSAAFRDPEYIDTMSTVRIRALRLSDWNTIDRSMLQSLLCKRTAASYVAAFTDMLVAEVSDHRSIAIYDWGCLCVIDEIASGYINVDKQEEDEAFRQYLDFLVEDVVYPCSSSDEIEVSKPTDEDQDSLTLLFSGTEGRKNPIENDVVYLDPTESAEDRRKKALACALALSQSLALKGVELELQQWATESLNPLTLILAESGEVPDEEVTLRLYGRYVLLTCAAGRVIQGFRVHGVFICMKDLQYHVSHVHGRFHGFLHEVDGIGQALAMPADIDAESKVGGSILYHLMPLCVSLSFFLCLCQPSFPCLPL